MNLLAAGAACFGSLRAKIDFDLIDRREYAFGLLKAADFARELSVPQIAAIEFGVASGWGLLGMADLAARISAMTGVAIQVQHNH